MKRISWKNTPALAVLALLGASAAQAQDSGAVLPTVDVDGQRTGGLRLDAPAPTGSRLGLSLRETPASVEALDGAALRQRGDTSLQDAVTRFTGITGFGTPGDGGTALSARGFTGHGSVMTLLDGVRLYVGAGTVTFPFDTWTVGRVEALRGPASVLYGDSALGAAVNVVSKQPTRTQAPVEAHASWGADNTHALAFGTGGPLGERLSYRIDAVNRGSDGQVDRGRSSSNALSGSLRYDIDSSLSVTLQYDGGRQKPSRYFGTPLVDGHVQDGTEELNYNVRDSDIRYDDDWLRARVDWQLDGGIKLSNETWRLRAKRHWRNLETYEYDDAGSVDRYDYLEIFHDQTQVGNRLSASGDGRIGGLANKWSAGFELNRISFQHDNNFSFSGDSTVPLLGFDPGLFEGGDETVPAYRTKTRQRSVFAEDRLTLAPGVHLVGGLRYDSIGLDRRSLTSGAAFGKGLHAAGTRLGAVWELDPSRTLYAQWSRGADPVGSLVTLSQANSKFDLSTGQQVELGWKQAFGEKLGEWTVAGYQIRKKKLLTRDTQNPGQQVQVGAQSSRGLEATLALRPARGLSIEANLAWVRARFDDFTESVSGVAVSRDGKQPTNVPRLSSNLWAHYAFTDGWKGGVGLRQVGKRYSDNANLHELPSFVVVDAYVAWRPAANYELTLRGFNLGDRRYVHAAYTDTQWILGAPRGFELAAKLSF